MDVIAKARELGHAIQEMDSYKKMMTLSKECDADKDLQSKVDYFNDLREKINQEVMKDEKDNEKINSMDNDIRKAYDDIMSNPKMMKLNAAKESFTQSVTFINQIITASSNGENPDTVEKTESCSGSCSTCRGCH